MIGGGISKKRRIFSLTSSAILILSILLIGISIQVPNATAAVNHDVGNLDINMLTDFGRVLGPITWGPLQSTNDPLTGIGFIGLVIDQANYNHPPGSEQVADSYANYYYAVQDDLQPVKSIKFVVNDETTQKSVASFNNSGLGTGDPFDILIDQTVWTIKDKDWAILQWTLNNLKSVPINNVCFGLELPLSQVGAGLWSGVGGDSGDDIDGFDSVNNVYWAQDNGGAGTCLGFGSAIVSDPITHYYSEDYHPADYDTYKVFWEDDAWLYNRIHAPNSVIGATPGNRTSTVGWNGITIDVGESRTFTLVIAINNTFADMITALKDAQYYYHYKATGFCITEFSDDQSGVTPQRIEVYNIGREPTDLAADGYFLSNDGGATSLPGSWNPTFIPTYGHSAFSVTGTLIGPEGDTLGLYQNLGGGNILLVDGPFSYGQEGIIPDPLDSESVARRFDAASASYMDEWLRNASSGPTWNAQNDVGSVKTSFVALNRVMFNPIDAEEGYVEVMYRGGGQVDISGYKIVCDDAFIVPSGTVLNSTNRFFVLSQSNYPSNFDLDDGTANGDNVYLYDENGDLLDMVGWNSPHNPGGYMSRSPDGNGSYQGYNDITSQAAGWIFNQRPSLLITEFYVDSASAQIEVYNPRGGDKVLDAIPPRWILGVDSGMLSGNWAPSTVSPGGYSTFTMSGGSPKDEGDTIRLYYNPGPSPIFIEEVSFGTSGIAPDPLAGESTARYWDDTIPGYTNNWTREDNPTFGGQNDVPAIELAPFVILNEVMFNPGIVPDGRYIVIINNQGFGIVISNYCLVCDGLYQLPTIGLPPFAMLLVNYTNAPALFDTMDITGDNVYFYDDNGRLLDMVGWNTAHTQGTSVRRVPDGNGTYQGYNDITSKAAGWVFNSTLQVLMTEISDDGSAQAQIEIYNPLFSTIDFSAGFTFESDSTPPGPLPGGWWIPTADSGGYAVFNVTSGLDPEGDTIGFYQNGFLINEISYGLQGTVPDPLPDESVQRYWDGSSYTNLWERNWTSGPNFGAQNDVPPDNLSSSIILNEVLFNPSTTSNHFVEIFNYDATDINISGYKLVCDTEYTIPDGTVLNFFETFFYLFYGLDRAFFDNMSSTGDNVYLYDANGSLVDMVGWNSPHSIDGTVSRIPDGNGTRDGYDDVSSVAAGWRFDQIPSISNIQIGPDTEQYCVSGENVTYYLTIWNKHDTDDVVDISNFTGPWGWEIITLNETGAPLSDSDGSGLPDVFVPAWGRVYIIVVVVVPSDAPKGENETTIITAQSTFNSLFRDNATLITRIGIFEMVTFPAGSFVIPMDDKQSDVLKAFGFVHALLRNGTTIYRIIEPPDVVIHTVMFPLDEIFAGGPILIMAYDANVVNVVHQSFSSVALDTTISQFVSDRVDVIYKPTNILLIYGVFGHTQDVLADMDIPFTMVDRVDVENNPGMLFNYDLIVDDCPGWSGNVPSTVANDMQIVAEQGGEVIFTDIALRDLDAVFPGYIPVTPNVGGTWSCSVHNIPEFPGQYYGPTTLDIYTMGGGQLMMAPTDPNVRIMVDCDDYSGAYRVLAAYFYYGSSSYKGGVVEGFGYHPGDQPPDARVLASIFFGNKFVHLPPQQEPLDISPPRLYIKAVGDNIILNWTQHDLRGVSHYLIYRSTSQTGFDFSDIWVNTSLHDDNGTIPLRTTWNDTGAASDNAPQEYYYIIRTVYETGEISHTSRTVGKWTKTFPQGISTFSLPLEPLRTMNRSVDYYLKDMNAGYIKWMHPGSHRWMKHGDGGVNDTQMKVGEGYEVKFYSQSTYTFTGMPGAMIIYDDDIQFLGFDSDSEARNLTVFIEQNGDVNLTWQEPANMDVGDWYEVYYSNRRDGFFGTIGIGYLPACSPVNFGTNTATHEGAKANDPGTRLYYMVVPVNLSFGWGASTYSIGIWTEEYLLEYDTIGIPLKLSSNHTADWYCDNIPDTVGINYFIYGEQRWCWHSTRMPGGAYDPFLVMTEGYQISTSQATKFTFIGV